MTQMSPGQKPVEDVIQLMAGRNLAVELRHAVTSHIMRTDDCLHAELGDFLLRIVTGCN